MNTASSCGSGFIAWGSCKAGESVLSGLGHALVNVLAWPLQAFVSPGQAPTAQQLVATSAVVAAGVAVRAWRLRTPLGVDLRDAASLVADAVAPHPRVAAYCRDLGRGAARVGAVAGRWLGWAVAHRHGRLGRLLLMFVVGYVVLGAAGHLFGWLPGLVTVPAAVHGLAVLGRRPAPSSDWWGETTLVGALQAAAVIPRPRVGETPPALRRHGPPRHSDAGTAVVVVLPNTSWTQLLNRAEHVAAALGLDGSRLIVSHPDGAPSNVVQMMYAVAAPAVSPPAQVAGQPRTRWADRVRIGVDPHGQPVHLQTAEANLLLAGLPGSGKTTLARTVLAHFALDPDATLYVLDGKGSTADYGDCRPLCSAFASGTDEDAADQLETMLNRVLDVVRARNAASATAPPPGGLLLLLEELQDVRAGAEQVQRKRLDVTLGRIVRMGRAVGVVVVVSTQRPTREDLPTGVRNLMSQRLVLQVRSVEDALVVLGRVPDLPLPTRRGQGLLATSAGDLAVRLDHLDAAAWRAVCTRAAALRARPVDLSKPVLLAKPDRQVELEPVPAQLAEPELELVPVAAAEVALVDVDPLLEAVCALLEQDSRGLSAGVLLALLPEGLRPSSAPLLGKALAQHPGRVERATATDTGTRRSRPVWRLLPVRAPGSARALPVRASDLPVRAPDLPVRAAPAARARSPRAGGKPGQTDRLVPTQGGEAPLPADTPGRQP